MMSQSIVSFSDLRGDWYRGADLMARLIDRSRTGEPQLAGFPAQWIPIFEHFGANWTGPVTPNYYVPIVSDMAIEPFVQLVASAKRRGHSRILAESMAALDPLLADVLYKLDRRAEVSGVVEGTVPLTGWQSYGRPEILEFTNRVRRCSQAQKPAAILLPCSRTRPYSRSKTHKRILSEIEPRNFVADRIVVSSLGVIPQAFWDDPVVLAYDSGVPDIYRILRIMREFFGKLRYDVVMNCLEFEPYRDCLRIVQQEGLIRKLVPGPVRKIKRLPKP
jgi:hypothetical protein